MFTCFFFTRTSRAFPLFYYTFDDLFLPSNHSLVIHKMKKGHPRENGLFLIYVDNHTHLKVASTTTMTTTVEIWLITCLMYN